MKNIVANNDAYKYVLPLCNIKVINMFTTRLKYDRWTLLSKFKSNTAVWNKVGSGAYRLTPAQYNENNRTGVGSALWRRSRALHFTSRTT